MSAKWQHVQVARSDPAQIITDGLYDAEKGHWIIRDITIGGRMQLLRSDADRIAALFNDQPEPDVRTHCLTCNHTWEDHYQIPSNKLVSGAQCRVDVCDCEQFAGWPMPGWERAGTPSPDAAEPEPPQPDVAALSDEDLVAAAHANRQRWWTLVARADDPEVDPEIDKALRLNADYRAEAERRGLLS